MANKKIDSLKKLQLRILRIQQGNFHKKERIIILFEGVDTSGKGGAIRRITENLDPRGFTVHPIGVPTEDEQGKHYLYRFWKKLPSKGMIAVFDRSWYGRVLVERVEKLIDKKTYERAYSEINQFEKMLTDDGVKIIKICLQISKKEQLKRLEERLKDPYKQWKITKDDIKNRSHWNQYQKAYEEMLKWTDTKSSPWHVVKTDNKEEARSKVLEIIADECRSIESWMEKNAKSIDLSEIKKALKSLH